MEDVTEPLFGSCCFSIAWQVSVNHFPTICFHRILIIYTFLSLKHSFLLALRVYSFFSASFFFSYFQFVDGPWSSLLEYLLTSLLSALKFSPTPVFPPTTYLKGTPLNSVSSPDFTFLSSDVWYTLQVICPAITSILLA